MEIATEAAILAAAGAASLHIHARDLAGEPTYLRARYGEIISAIKAVAPDLLICVSTSGRQFSEFEQRSDVLDLDGDLTPDLASLTLGSFNFPTGPSTNSPEMIRRLAGRMRERGIVPELEIFDAGMLDYADFLIDRGILQPPFVFNLLLGSLGTIAATTSNLAMLVERLPEGAYWQAAGIGRAQWPMNALGVVMGGHVRTGLEDNLYMDTEKKRDASNDSLVRRVAGLAAALGRPLAGPAQARQIMGLSAR